MGVVRKWTGQKGAVERQQRQLAAQEAAARDAEQRQTNAMNASIQQAARSMAAQQEREAAQAAASAELSKPLAQADVPLGTDNGVDIMGAAKTRRKQFGSTYNSGVRI